LRAQFAVFGSPSGLPLAVFMSGLENLRGSGRACKLLTDAAAARYGNAALWLQTMRVFQFLCTQDDAPYTVLT
jgi:hypothetical protein